MLYVCIARLDLHRLGAYPAWICPWKKEAFFFYTIGGSELHLRKVRNRGRLQGILVNLENNLGAGENFTSRAFWERAINAAGCPTSEPRAVTQS